MPRHPGLELAANRVAAAGKRPIRIPDGPPARLTEFVDRLRARGFQGEAPPAPTPRRRKRSTSPTQRTLARLRREGYTAIVVEHRIPVPEHFRRAGKFWNNTRDLWGLDVVAVRPDQPGVLGVQATTMTNLASRRKKLGGIGELAVWLAAGNRIELWGWAKRGPRGARKTWDVTREPITRFA